MTKYSERTDRDDCYICSRGNPDVLEKHHLIPRRHDGGDSAANLVELCPTCHEALERLYGQWFWATVSVLSEERQLNIILDDIRDRLSGLHLELLLGVEDLKSDLEEDYRVGVDDAKATAIQKSTNGIETGTRREAVTSVKKTIRSAQESYPDLSGAPEKVVVSALCGGDVDEDDVYAELSKLEEKGELYYPDEGIMRLV